MQGATVIDLEAFRNRKNRDREALAASVFPWPGAWVLVWFAPVVLVQPWLGSAVR